MKLSTMACAGIALAALVLACSQKTAVGTENGPTPHYSVYLTGKVLDKDNRPIVNAVANVRGLSLSDTTDAEGVYTIIDSTPTDLLRKNSAAADSLQILRDGQLITMLEISAWIDTLPDVFVIQRDIYGDFAVHDSAIGTIRAVITGDGIPGDRPKTADLWYNAANNSYSGFVYFVYTPQVKQYSVAVEVFSFDSILIGRSVDVPFPSTAGNINVPVFRPGNMRPVVSAGRDTTVSIGDTVHLCGTAVDSFGGTIAAWEWSVDDSVFAFSDSDTTIIAPSAPRTAMPCILRVTDNDGNAVSDTMRVAVVIDRPVVTAAADTEVSINDTVRLYAQAADIFGTIAAWQWDVGMTGTFVPVSKSDTSIVAPPTAGTISCVVTAIDDDGQAGVDTLTVRVVADTPVIALSDTVVCRGDPALLTVSVTNRYGSIVSYAWDIGGRGTFVVMSHPDTVIVVPPDADTLVNCVVRVTDDDGLSATDTLHLHVPVTGQYWVHGTSPMANPSYVQLQPFGGKLLLFERDAGGDKKNSIWSTTNGTTWDLVCDSAPYSPRSYFATVDFGGKVWVLGGAGDTTAWNSSDGIAWTMVSACSGLGKTNKFTIARPFSGGVFFACFGNGIGQVCTSSDGIAWTTMAYTPGFDMSMLTSVDTLNGKLWLIAPKGMVWSSTDGYTWEGIQVKAPVAGADSVSLGPTSFGCVINGSLTVISPPWVFCSSHGAVWTASRLMGEPPPPSTLQISIAVFDDKIWLANGQGTWYSK